MNHFNDLTLLGRCPQARSMLEICLIVQVSFLGSKEAPIDGQTSLPLDIPTRLLRSGSSSLYNAGKYEIYNITNITTNDKDEDNRPRWIYILEKVVVER